MPGSGKYTVYAPPASPKNDRMNKLYGHDDNPYKDLVGKEVDTRAQVIARGIEFMQPEDDLQPPGDDSVSMFPGESEIDFGYSEAPETATEVSWDSAGDPANPYMPDLRSPGPGITDAIASPTLQTNPEITPQEIVGEGFVEPGDTKTEWEGEASPAVTKTAIKTTSRLGTNPTLGTSDDTKPFT